MANLKWYDLFDQQGRPDKKQLTSSHLEVLLAAGYTLAEKPKLRTAVPKDLLTKDVPASEE